MFSFFQNRFIDIIVLVTYWCFAVIWPVFRSSRIVRGKEPGTNKEIILKFW